MKNKILLLIVLLLSVVEVISLRYKTQTNFSLPKKEISIKSPKTNTITKEDLEDYIIGVVGAEMPASFNEEALKAQAVASRTYAVYKMNHSSNDYDVVADISNQAYQTNDELKEKWQGDYNYYYNRVKKAVLDTKDEVMTYNGEVIIAYYFAMSNGYTEDSSLVFNEYRPYLKSKPSLQEDNSLKNFTYEKEYSKVELCRLLNIDDFIINDVKRSSTNRINTITINNQVFSGTEIRKMLDLRSTDFDIVLDGDIVRITTRGYGHGVGLSQYGANLMANDGYKYEEILKYYYTGIEISKI